MQNPHILPSEAIAEERRVWAVGGAFFVLAPTCLQVTMNIWVPMAVGRCADTWEI